MCVHITLSGEKILLCDEVITTGESIRLAIKAVEKENAVVLPRIVALVNRSGLDEIDGRKIVALITYPMPQWHSDECPLCKVGSEAISPKVGNNWKRLNAVY
jgi:orotate phosphoribosyltransferase